MPGPNLLRHEFVSLRDQGLDEDWVQRHIAEDPSRLGLAGSLTAIRERKHAGAGRLDILLVDNDSERKYEVEVQLGKTDESHIIRCVEYWDVERKRSPRSEHVAVLVAEDITARFFNVIQLFNRAIPIIAIKMVASKVGDGFVLQFIKVLDEAYYHRQREEEEQEPAANQVIDRAHWDRVAGAHSMQIVDSLLRYIGESTEGVKLNYLPTRIRAQVNGVSLPIRIHPKKKFVDLSIDFADEKAASDWRSKLEAAGLSDPGDRIWRPITVEFRLTGESLQSNEPLVKAILEEAAKGG